MLEKKERKRIIDYFLIIFIIFVSSVDFYLSLFCCDTLHETELNPIGKWLIDINNKKIDLFMSVKFFTTCLTLIILLELFNHYSKMARVILYGLSFFQLLLLIFLLYY